MNILLDTHAFLWFVFADLSLSAYAKGLIEDESNVKFLSMASIWEMAIKYSIDKLPLIRPLKFEDFMVHQIRSNGLIVLPINFSHLAHVSSLPVHHRDPFDRLIIAQSVVEKMPVISIDRAFDAYGVTRLW